MCHVIRIYLPLQPGIQSPVVSGAQLTEGGQPEEAMGQSRGSEYLLFPIILFPFAQQQPRHHLGIQSSCKQGSILADGGCAPGQANRHVTFPRPQGCAERKPHHLIHSDERNSEEVYRGYHKRSAFLTAGAFAAIMPPPG